MDANPFEVFVKEFPTLAARFDDLVDAQRDLPSLDAKIKQDQYRD